MTPQSCLAARSVMLALALLAAPFGSASAETAGDLAKAMIEEVRKVAPPSSKPLTGDDVRILHLAINKLLISSYFDVDLVNAREEAIRAIDAAAADATNDSSALMESGLRAVVDVIGHGARVVSRETDPATSANELRPLQSVASVGVIVLRDFNLADIHDPDGCTRVSSRIYAMVRPEDRSVVLDLRGNEGGRLSDIACVAGVFLRDRRPVFVALMKIGAEDFTPQRVEGVLQKLPMSVVIDAKTDSGGLLLAAVLQDRRRASIVGEQKSQISSEFHYLIDVAPLGGVRVPAGELLYGERKRRLSEGVRIDSRVPGDDEVALMREAMSHLHRSR